MEIGRIRERLRSKEGPAYWRSLEELAADPEFREALSREFPEGASNWDDGLSRRDFLGVMGASLALAGLVGCGYQPPEKIVPYVNAPESFVPGKPLYYATTVPLRGIGTGVLVESHMGRPTHVEGNSVRAEELGGMDILTQGSLLTLYDPDRSQNALYLDQILSWDSFVAYMQPRLAGLRESGGEGLRILTDTVTSPSLLDALDGLLAAFPNARRHRWEAVSSHNRRAGTAQAAGRDLEPWYRFDRAARILSLDADFLNSIPENVGPTRRFAEGRRARAGNQDLNRLYVVEPTPTLTGAAADHRLPLRASEVAPFARALARRLGLATAGPEWAPPSGSQKRWLSAVADDLRSHPGASIVVAGEGQPPELHALALQMNRALGNVGSTVLLRPPLDPLPEAPEASMAELARDMKAGKVSTLVILGGNPVLTAPADLGFADALGAVELSIHLGLFRDETAHRTTWHLPAAHPLESWGDCPDADGTIILMQPLIAPLYDGRTPHEVVAFLSGVDYPGAYELTRGYWQRRLNLQGEAFETAWRSALHDGYVHATRVEPDGGPAAGGGGGPRDQAEAPSSAPGSPPSGSGSPASAPGDYEVVFRPDPMVFDGRYANNGWLQELAKPNTKLTWDNAAYLSPRSAEELGVERGDVVRVTLGGRRLEAPVLVVPGQADRSVALFLGYGRTRAGRLGNGRGYDAYPLRTSGALWFAGGAVVERTGGHRHLVTTQHHWNMEGRSIICEAGLADFLRDPRSPLKDHEGAGSTVLPFYQYTGNSWGMSIDLTACIGCSACTIACQSENNIPVVGRDQVDKGREMQWIRIDTYYEGDLENPRTSHQPVPCMQCDKAPCELVCPVDATSHSSDGLNMMIYNRCIGTRYCSNNCPYKVRRFNFLHFSDSDTESFKAMRNPNVTVRGRGVMEKCTYCVQRIEEARITATKEERSIGDGEVVTACQSACPTRAIWFGDMNDPKAKINDLKSQPHNYGLLAELNTLPRTSYLAKIRNPNPDLEG